jgi:hypothetical protein
MTHDLYATWRPAASPAQLLRAGRAFTWGWGVLLTLTALGFHALAGGRDTPVVVMALSIASVTYGALLGAVALAAWGGPRLGGRDVIAGAALSVAVMLAAVAGAGLSFTWAVPLGTALTVGTAWLSARLSVRRNPPA